MRGRRLVRSVLLAGLVLLPLAACEGGRRGSLMHPSAAAASTSAPIERRPPTSIPFFGLDVPGADLAETRRVAGVLGCRPTVVSAFVKLDSRFTVANLRRLASDGATPFLTLEPWLQSMRSGNVHDSAFSLRSTADGAHDHQLASIARAIAAYGQHVYLRYAHEMNGSWYPWGDSVNGGSPAEYVKAWRHVHDVFRAAGAGNVSWVWAPTAIAAGPADGSRLAALYPGDAYVDYVGFTGYAHGPSSARETFGPWVAAAVAITRRPVILAEIGAEGTGKTQWIESLGPFLQQTPAIVGFIWFNTSPASVGATGYYRIDDSAPDAAAMRRVLASLNVRCQQQTEGTKP